MSKIGDVLTGAVVGTAISSAVNAVSGAISALFMTNRSIGGIIPDVTFEEHHNDTLTITDHPVEVGAAISDHAFKNPSEVTMRVGWSNSKSLINSIVSGSLFSGQINNANDLYNQMLKLQEARTVFDLVTGKRTYNNMLVKGIAVTTNHESENALIMDVSMRQVILVETSTATLTPASSQESPQDTAAVQNAGTKQPTKAQNQSALFSLFGEY